MTQYLTEEQHYLIVDNIGFAKAYAYGIFKTWPMCEWDDAIGDGMVGLVEAAYNFDPSLGHKFTTYAAHRIRSEILDGIRRRNGRRKDINGTYTFISEKAVSINKLGLHQYDNYDEDNKADYLLILGEEENYEEIELKYLRKDIARAIERFNDRDKMILTLYFFEGMSMKEIGEVYDLTESRVCQIVRYVRERLNRIFVDAA